MKNKLIIAASVGLAFICSAAPAFATHRIGNGQSYFIDSTVAGTVAAAVDSIVPPDVGYIDVGASNYFYIGGSNSGNGEVQAGIRKGRLNTTGIFFADHYFMYKNTSGTFQYQKIDSVTEANNTSVSYRVDHGGAGAAGYWSGTVYVNGVAHPSGLYYTGYSSLNRVFVQTQSVGGCSTYSNHDTPFSNFWDLRSSWYRLTSATAPYNGDTYSCSSSGPINSISNSGTINNGSTGYCKTH